MILIFSVNTNHESVAYRSFSPSKFEARGARKVTTGIDLSCPYPESRPPGARHCIWSLGMSSRQSRGITPPGAVSERSERCRALRLGGPLVRALPACKGGCPQELACGSQAFIATLLFDPSMSALPIIPKQNSVSVGLFTH